jgi:dTDP-4-dehydrorhamnose reductase
MSGLLGKYINLTRSDCDLWGTYNLHPIGYPNTIKMDLLKPEDIVYAFNKAQPDVVIHCAGEGSVDYCERRPDYARKVIVDPMEWIVRCCNENDALLVYVSTNAVFGGGDAPYSEQDIPKPVSKYGWLKVGAEVCAAMTHRYLIVRPILLYGWNWPWGRGNWMTMIWEGRQWGKVKETWRIVADRVTQPTSAEACARAIWRLIEMEQTGIFHVGGADVLPLYDFCREVAIASGIDPVRIKPALSSEFPNLARRPIDTHYDLSKIKALGIEPEGVLEGLQRYLKPELINAL